MSLIRSMLVWMMVAVFPFIICVVIETICLVTQEVWRLRVEFLESFILDLYKLDKKLSNVIDKILGK